MTIRLLPLVTAMLLSACVSSLLSGKPQQQFSLVPVAAPAVVLPAHAGLTVRIIRTQVPAAYRDNQLVLLRGMESSIYAGQGWDAPLPDLLSAALARDLATLLPGSAVVAETASVQATLEVQTEVRTFATVQDAAGSRVVMDLDLRVVDAASRAIRQTLPFRFSQPLPALTTTATIAAYNQGWQQLLPQLAAALRQASDAAVPSGKLMLKSHHD